MSAPLVSIVVLSYNRPHLLRDALASVAAQTYPNLEVIVVDNRSPASAKVAEIVAAYPPFRLLACDANYGFTGGMNRGIRNSTGTFALLTEDDMVLAPDCVAEFVALLEARPEIGLASGLILKHGTNIIHYAGGDVELGAIYRQTILRAGEVDDGRREEPYPVRYVTGAMIFAQTEFLKQLGGFRDDFFMYFEDVELCQRVSRLGRPIVIAPGAQAWHFEPTPTPVPIRVEFHKAKNFLALYLLHAPARILPGFVLRYGCIGMLRTIFTAPRRSLCHLLGWGRTFARIFPLLRQRWSRR